jgi:DNA repair photolyase
VLFPDWPPRSNLIGIAKLAAESESLESKRRVEYREIATRRLIGRCSGERMPFDWTINPYRGCEFGCKYCYARYAHEFMELRDWRDFELKIFAKQWNAAAFRDELSKIPRDESIAIGTATDPYQPAERRYGITRKILEVLAQERGRSIWIATKSDLPARDADVLSQIAAANRIQVSFTITTMDENLARMLEPLAPRPWLRIGAIRKLSENGVRCGVLCCPLMPLINDSEANIERVARAAADAGATTMHGHVLFLKPCAKQVFLPFVEEQFPKLARRYKERYERSAFLKGDYPDMIQKRVKAVRERVGLENRAPAYDAKALASDQLELFQA